MISTHTALAQLDARHRAQGITMPHSGFITTEINILAQKITLALRE